MFFQIKDSVVACSLHTLLCLHKLPALQPDCQVNLRFEKFSSRLKNLLSVLFLFVLFFVICTLVVICYIFVISLYSCCLNYPREGEGSADVLTLPQWSKILTPDLMKQKDKYMIVWFGGEYTNRYSWTPNFGFQGWEVATRNYQTGDDPCPQIDHNARNLSSRTNIYAADRKY